MLPFISRRSFLSTAAVASFGALIPAVGAGQQRAGDAEISLRRQAEATGRFFGAAAQFDQIASDVNLKNVLLAHCSHISPEIHLKWNSIEWARGEFNFAPVDNLIAFAMAHDLKMQGHALIWDESTPPWAKAAILETKNWKLVQSYLSTVMSRYRNQIGHWDVVNEAVDTNAPDGLRTTTFLRAFGPDYIRRALEEARTHAPNAKLSIDDYSFEYENQTDRRRRRRFIQLLEGLRRSGAPLDRVGIQAHLDLGKGPLNQKTTEHFFSEIADLGLDIVISELDVMERDFSASFEERDRRVADETRRYLDVALAQPAVKGVITWGLSDKHSWLQEEKYSAMGKNLHEVGNLNRGLPFDQNFARKPMFTAIYSAFAARAV